MFATCSDGTCQHQHTRARRGLATQLHLHRFPCPFSCMCLPTPHTCVSFAPNRPRGHLEHHALLPSGPAQTLPRPRPALRAQPLTFPPLPSRSLHREVITRRTQHICTTWAMTTQTAPILHIIHPKVTPHARCTFVLPNNPRSTRCGTTGGRPWSLPSRREGPPPRPPAMGSWR